MSMSLNHNESLPAPEAAWIEGYEDSGRERERESFTAGRTMRTTVLSSGRAPQLGHTPHTCGDLRPHQHPLMYPRMRLCLFCDGNAHQGDESPPFSEEHTFYREHIL